MLQATYLKYNLRFKQPAGTSRGILTEKETWFIKIWRSEQPEIYGLGECALFRGLSADDRPGYEKKLKEFCEEISTTRDIHILRDWSSISFGVNTALSDLDNGGKRIIYHTPFTEGKKDIEINGLIWMGDKETMRQRIIEKLDAGFHCVKLENRGYQLRGRIRFITLYPKTIQQRSRRVASRRKRGFYPERGSPQTGRTVTL